ncbi:MAG: methylcobamide--CoM methyltransferase MtbA, partial [Clostridiales bacterium]|nr:methylcobamide--CoM methyltransferase MtbA [Clostridiales bacterium]
MSDTHMTSMERVLSAITHKEADRVPLMLLLSAYGANELGLPVTEYFSKATNIINAQLRMKKKYRNDCFYSFFYAPVEIEAWGGEVIFADDCPPNSGEPFIKSIEQFSRMDIPDVYSSKCLQKVLEATSGLKREAGGDTPVIGVVMSPYSIPVMQMGFDKYIELLYFNEKEFNILMKKNIEFCVSWANAQLEAGATAICYFDPLASPTIIERKTYLRTGFKVACETLGKIKGPTATHLASGSALPVLADIAATKTAILGFSTDDDIRQIKEASTNRICLLGNLNGIDMVNWDSKKAEAAVKELIAGAGKGGGLVISDNHGEVPLQVPEETLLAISDSVRKWGKYPLDWIN